MLFFIPLLLVMIAGFIIPNKKFNKLADVLMRSAWWVALGALIIGVAADMAGYKDGFLYEQMIEILAAGFIWVPISLVYIAANRNKENQTPEIQTPDMQTPREYIPLTAGQLLPKKLSDRTKIVKKFNAKFSLMLTDEQIKNIVEGSYHIREWAEEILAMDREYETPSEWYAGERAWLRAYLKAFNIQTVSSDFKLQYDICLSSFDEIFSSADIANCESVEECIKKINNKFFTNFDDPAFMVAYRFLQQNGRQYALPHAGVMKFTSEMDELKQRYRENEPTEQDEVRMMH